MTATALSEASRRMTAARTALLLDEPFFGALALRLRLREDPTCKTAWVDGRTLGYNPRYVMQLSAPELQALVAHEVMHCAAGHPWRRDARDPERWNHAADRAINPVLRDVGFTLPEGALFELDDTHHGKSAEWIYDRIPTPPSDDNGGGGGQGTGSSTANGQARTKPEDSDDGEGQSSGPSEGPENGAQRPRNGGSGQGRGSHSPDPTSPSTGQPEADAGGGGVPEFGEVRDAPSDVDDDTQGDDGEPAPNETEWQQAVQQAAALSQGRGTLPGALRRFVSDAVQPRIDWRSTLRRFVQEVARSDYTFARPNSRYVASGLYLPSLYTHEVGPIVVAVDTSGSVDTVLLEQFAAEIRTIADEVKPREVRIVYADAAVQAEEVFARDDVIELHPRGGGGTDFRPVFTHVATLDEPPVCVLYLTDLWGEFPKEAPDVPVLWVTPTAERAVPFGDVVSAA